MIGSIFVPMLLLTCLAEGMAKGQPRRAAHLKNLRLLIVIAWTAWTVQHSWSSSSLPPWLVFESVVGARVFLVAFFGVILWLVVTGLLESKLAELRTFQITANTVITAVFALIVGATIDWYASSPFIFVFALVNFAVLGGVTWKVASTGRDRRYSHAEIMKPEHSYSER